MFSQSVTIGITTYNAATSIERCLASVLKFNSSFQILVVDDCSTDKTYSLIEDITSSDINVEVLRNDENFGVAFSRNRIIENAKGEFIIFFDDDDESLPERIEEQYKRIVEYEEQFAKGAPVICHTNRKVIYPDKTEKIEKTMGLKLDCIAPHGVEVAERILLGTHLDDGYGACPTCCQMARTSTYKMLGGFDSDLRRGEDTDFNIRLALAGGHFVGVDKPLVIQTMTKTSDKSLSNEYFYWLKIINKHKDFIASYGQYEFTLDWLKLKQNWLEKKFVSFIFQFVKIALIYPMLTVKRVLNAWPNFLLNWRFSKFHSSANQD